MARAEAMDPEFERWMEETEIERDPKMRAARWKSLQALLTSPSTAQMECWVRLAFDMERIKPADQARDALVQAFKKNDANFDGKKGHELKMLASMALALLLKKDAEHGAEAALAIISASVGGTRAEVGPLGLVDRAQEHVERSIRRSGQDISIADMLEDAIGDFDVAPVVEKLASTINGETLKDAFIAMASAVQTHLEKLYGATLEAAKAADMVLARQEQELEMHWWLTGGRSNRLRIAFGDIPNLVRPLILAKELSDLTRDWLGPASIDALLMRGGVSETRTTTVPDLLAAYDPGIIAWLSRERCSPMTTPLQFAIERRNEVGAGSEWVAPWSIAAEIDTAREFTELALAMQFYRELRLLGMAPA